MKRKIYDQLLLWKNKRKGKSAMMIEGARRVGKSYIVKEFAQKEYKSYILIDFFKVGDDIKDLFKNYKDNLDMLFTYLSTYFSTSSIPGSPSSFLTRLNSVLQPVRPSSTWLRTADTTIWKPAPCSA